MQTSSNYTSSTRYPLWIFDLLATKSAMDPSHGQDQYQLDGEEGELVPSADSREHIEANENINFMEDLQNLLSIETFDKYVSPFNVPVDLTAGDVTSLDEQIQLEKLAWYVFWVRSSIKTPRGVAF